jgi:dimethylargininase
MVRIAITRPIPASLARCELTHLARTPIDLPKAVTQHRQYEEALAALGCRVRRVEAADDLPDSVFIEDVALVLDEIAIVTRPGASSRRPERESVAAVLSEYRQLQTIEAPGTVDGGDVLRVGRTIYVGLSTRTNEDGARQLARLVQPLGYTSECLQARGCLHLKSAATALDDERVLCNPDWIDRRLFGRLEVVDVDQDEPNAANVLRIGRTLICSAACTRTTDALRERGYPIVAVDMSELAKAEGAVTCCSLIVEQT